MAKVLASDFSDGTFDAKQGTTALSFYNANFVNAWSNWVQNFYSSFAQLSNIVALNRWYGGFNITDKNSVVSFTDATPIRTENGIEEYACSGEGRIKSSTGASIYMDFVNQRGSNMNVYWLDYNTGRVSYKSNLATEQTHNQQTFVTHPWLITDNTGACLGIYRPVTASKKTITFKANEVVLAGVAAPVDTVDPLKPIRTINGVEEYRCDSWSKIGNGTADGTPTLSFVNQLGTNTSLELSGLSSINRTTLIFGGLQNTATYKDPNKALKNQFVKISKGSGECVAVVKAISNDDKTITVTSSGIDVTNMPVANGCSSQGSDNKLGFTNAPTDFCGFTKVTSTAITNPDTYNFFNADKKENVEVTVVNNAVTSVSIENDKYGFACGVGSFPACSGVTLNAANTNTTEFLFNNTALSVVNGASQGITVKNGSLIHQAGNGSSGAFTVNTSVCGIANTSCQSGIINDFAAITLRNGANNSVCTISKANGSLIASNGGNTVTAGLNGEATDTYVNAGVAHVVNATNRSPVNGAVVDTVQINWGASGINAVTVNAQDNTVKFVCVP
jgi:hypothetical protein